MEPKNTDLLKGKSSWSVWRSRGVEQKKTEYKCSGSQTEV